MDEQVIKTAVGTERKMYSALTEVMELTEELTDAVQRQDQVSVRLFLSMRQEPINQLRDHKALLQRQCKELPAPQGEQLRRILSGETQGEIPGAQDLEKLVRQNKSLLDRVIRADEKVNRRVSGDKSICVAPTKRR